MTKIRIPLPGGGLAIYNTGTLVAGPPLRFL
jgi:hypothetical protein